ncbi:MAG: DUF1287 domain-containing protein [Oscillospiraceae bacterium]|nr:DUF1287 domain-containing protein [Oscillospiraceae bacterium]
MLQFIKKLFFVVFTIFIVIVLIPGLKLALYYNLIPLPYYSGEDFGIETVCSSVDYNQNGIDDYMDILLGARADAENHPKYDGSYQENGYPPDDIGVCTDVVWRGFKNAGYSLRYMVDKDIAMYPEDYPRVTKRDDKIDFRRVVNLRVFFDKYAVELTTDTSQTDQWQGGDIVIFKDNKHIGIVSDRRTRDGRVYIIHNGGQPVREEDYLKRGEVIRHYRFDASVIPDDVLVAWEG